MNIHNTYKYSKRKRMTERGKQIRNEERKLNYRKGGFMFGPRLAWTSRELNLLLTWTNTDRKLAKVLQRSVPAIQSKRNKYKALGK